MLKTVSILIMTGLLSLGAVASAKEVLSLGGMAAFMDDVLGGEESAPSACSFAPGASPQETYNTVESYTLCEALVQAREDILGAKRVDYRVRHTYGAVAVGSLYTHEWQVQRRIGDVQGGYRLIENVPWQNYL